MITFEGEKEPTGVSGEDDVGERDSEAQTDSQGATAKILEIGDESLDQGRDGGRVEEATNQSVELTALNSKL